MKSTKFSTRDFIFGIFVGGFFIAILAFFQIKDMVPANTVMIAGNNVSGGTQQSSQDMEQELKVYNTRIADWEVTSSDGTTFNLKTPNGYYSLSDQYAESINQYYNITMDDSSVICVGDNSQQYNSTVLINAATLSTTKALVETMYADNADVDLSTFTYSEAYEYMVNGKEPDEESGVVLKELDPLVDSAGHKFRVYQVDRDTEYYTDDTRTETEIVHSTELVAYSGNEDALEVLVYMQTYDEETAVYILSEFIN